MHKSRLGGLIIDCRTDDLTAATVFWSAALGRPQRNSDAPEDAGYALLDRGPEEMHIELQRVGHDSRVHLDIETDDIAAEVERLEALGARRVQQVRNWWVMEAPTGHHFCVVRPQHDDFEATASKW